MPRIINLKLFLPLFVLLLFACSSPADDIARKASERITQISLAEFDESLDKATFNQEEEYRKVLSSIDNGLLQYPDNMKLLGLRLILHSSFGNLELAQKDAMHMVALNPKHITAQSMLCFINNKLNLNPTEAELCFRNIAELVRTAHSFTPYGDIHEGEYIVYLLLGKHPEAATKRDGYLKKLQEHDPSSVWMYEMLFEAAEDGSFSYNFGTEGY